MAAKNTDKHTAPLWIEQGEARTCPLISVAPLAPIDKVYTFTADAALADRLAVGQRVNVPFGRKGTLRPAIVVTKETGPWSSTLKSVAEILDPAGRLSEHLLELGRWMARYYLCPLGRALAAMVPAAVRTQRGFVTVRKVKINIDAQAAEELRLGARQKAIVQHLLDGDGEANAGDLLTATGASRNSLKRLIELEIVSETVTKEPPNYSAGHNHVEDPSFELNSAQALAVDRIAAAANAAAFRALLLFGVSGSGKTEVYVHAMRQVIAAGRQAIMLVPEIALTTQLMQRLAVRFERVAVIHSGLTDVQRSLAWEAIRTGKVDVVIGTRSAVFAPCPNLGLIIVDEEQEPSFKNLQSPRFHVRDLAIKRAHLLDIPIVLGSATPSLETWRNAMVNPAYERLDLPERVRDLPMPAVRLVDMREVRGPEAGAALSQPLLNAMREALDRGEQAVLLMNRRGYATWLFCPACRRRMECPQCRSSLVLHRSQAKLICHHCHTSYDIPTRCLDPSCQSELVHGGGGTERIEAQVRSAFPTARIHRADSDTMTHARKYRALVDAFEAGEIDILLGTQMIAKGLDFPNVSLVGVVGADLTAAADLRGAERLFQLVTQVAGRAGRADVPGRVLVQTASPDEPALRFAIGHDFTGFAEVEMKSRQALGMPPFVRLTRFVLAGRREFEVLEQGEELAKRLRETIATQAAPHASVLGPHPCAIERIRNAYRYEVLLRTDGPGAMHAVLDHARHEGHLKIKGPSLIVDVDPVNLS